jgi:hypothetical protein
MEKLAAVAAKHAKEVYGYTDAQLSDPKMVEKIKAAAKKE